MRFIEVPPGRQSGWGYITASGERLPGDVDGRAYLTHTAAIVRIETYRTERQ
jgi:hypothetical protein